MRKGKNRGDLAPELQFRYSGLDLLFVRLVNEKRVSLEQLQGIRQENWERISSFVENVLEK